MRLYLSWLLSAAATIVMGLIATRYIHSFWYFSPFYNAQTHFGLFAAFLALLAFLLHRKLPVLLLVAAGLVLALYPVARIARLADMATAQEVAGKPTLRLLSFNILGNNKENGAAIRDEILLSDVDVAIILEARPLESHLEALAARYPFRLGCHVMTEHCDLMILSRLPFTSFKVDNLSDLRKERYMQVTVDVAGQSVNVVAAHLSKAWFDDYHATELWRLSRRLEKLEGPLVLAGDFNASSLGADMGWFLRQTGLRRAPNEPATWPVEFVEAGLAIDHIYARAPMRLSKLDRLTDNHGSNHFGLQAELIIDQTPPPSQ